MNIIHFLNQKRVLPVASFLLIISFISSSELIYHLLRHEYLNGLITFLFSLLVFLLPVFLFRKNFKLYLILLLPVFLLVPFNLAYVLYFDSKISEATVLMLINTNKNEAFELVKSYFHVLAIYIIIYLGVLYLLYRNIPSGISTKKAKYVSLFALGSLAISPLPIYLHGHDDTSYVGDLQKALYDIFPGTLIGGFQNVWHQNNFIKATEKDRDKFSFFSKQDSSITDKQVHILIIGESSRYDHWGINGYKINTTPLLSKRNDLISYSNTSSGGFMTEWAVPLLLTGVGADNYNLHIKRKGIVSTFNETGFATYWITNQTGFLGNIKIHSLEAQKGYYLLTDFRAIKNIHRDMELVDTLKKVLAEPGNKKFIVIHTLGSHYNYSARYPDKFDIIKPSNKTISSEITDKRFKNVLINSYDNSIMYTDAVIDSVINMVSRLNSFSSVTYISDHGEDLFDDDRGFTAHYHGAPPSKYDAHVPFLIWCSPKLKAAYPDKIVNLVKHKDAKVSSQNLIYTVTSMVGIHYPGQDSVKDLTSSGFKNNKQLIFGEYNKVYSFSDLK